MLPVRRPDEHSHGNIRYDGRSERNHSKDESTGIFRLRFAAKISLRELTRFGSPLLIVEHRCVNPWLTLLAVIKMEKLGNLFELFNDSVTT